jgi:hypothetical protein
MIKAKIDLRCMGKGIEPPGVSATLESHGKSFVLLNMTETRESNPEEDAVRKSITTCISLGDLARAVKTMQIAAGEDDV